VEGRPPAWGGWVTPRTAIGVDVGDATDGADALGTSSSDVTSTALAVLVADGGPVNAGVPVA